jgi:hypothetical protein
MPMACLCQEESVARTQASQSRLREFALVGARARLQELQREEGLIRQDFPELFRGPARRNDGAAPTQRRRRRRPMSPAQKRAVSERMKKYWAERRKKNA